MTSLTEKLRSRFRPEKSPAPSLDEKDDDRSSEHSEDSKDEGSPSRERSEELDEKRVYELQLSQLQEQLVAAMIENQSLDAEVKSLRKGTRVAELQEEVDTEKRKNKALQEHMDFAQKSQIRGIYTRDISDWVDVAHEASEESPAHVIGDPNAPRPGLIDKLSNWLVSAYFELLADLTEDVEPTETPEKDSDQLAVKKLKDNIKRFKKDVKPLGSTAKGLRRVMTWKNPALTFITFVVYMYSVWYGWLLPVVLFIMILKLSVNYLRHRGLNINLVLLADEEEDERDADAFRELGVSAKFDLVVQVARKVQNTLSALADNLEKLQNLLLWEQPAVTRRLYLFLCGLFVLSSALPGTTLFTVLALLFGVRVFIIQFIYTKFPRIKQRHDGTRHMWRSLPTDADIQEHYHKAALDRCVLPSAGDQADVGSAGSATRSGAVSQRDAEFAELFQLPTSERPLPAWKGGKRCTLIDKEKSLRSTFKTGKLYLTNSFLCFERHKTLTHAQMNVLIPLTDILSISKAKPYSWIPGEGMSIAVTVFGQEKPYTFGAILNRDEVYHSIMAHAVKLDLPWAASHRETSPSKSSLKADEADENRSEGTPVDEPQRGEDGADGNADAHNQFL